MADPAARAAWVHEHVDADLQFIFQEAGMSEQVQLDIGQHYKTVRRFSALADTRADLRTALAADFTLRADNAAGTAEVAAVVAAWGSSRQSYEEEIKLRQEAKGLGLTRPLPHTPPMIARYAGRAENFVDGLGLCSPGRWHPSFRARSATCEQTDFAASLRDMVDKFCRDKIKDLAKQTFQLALGRFKESPFSKTDLDDLRRKWFNLLPDPRQAEVLIPGQPFYLHALVQSLRQLGDPDVDIIDNSPGSSFVDGVHLGHGRTQVYRRKVKQSKYDESEWSQEMGN